MGYVLNESGGFRWLIPSFAVQFHRVTMKKSNSRDGEDFHRLRLNASWATPVFALGGLSAHVDVRFAWDSNQTDLAKELGLDSSQYLAGGLKYYFGEPVLGVMHGLHVMVSDGRIPPVTTDETTLHLGLFVFK